MNRLDPSGDDAHEFGPATSVSMLGTEFEAQECKWCNAFTLQLLSAPAMTINWLAEHLEDFRAVPA